MSESTNRASSRSLASESTNASFDLFVQLVELVLDFQLGLATRGDPGNPHVAYGGKDDGIDDTMRAKVHGALALYRPLDAIENIEIRMHETILYNSIYQADDHLFINQHVYGVPEAHSPVLGLRKAKHDDLFSSYRDSLEHVWSVAVLLDR